MLTVQVYGCTVGQMTKRLLVEMPELEHRKIKAAAAAAGWEISALLRRLLALWLAGKIKPGNPPGRGET